MQHTIADISHSGTAGFTVIRLDGGIPCTVRAYPSSTEIRDPFGPPPRCAYLLTSRAPYPDEMWLDVDADDAVFEAGGVRVTLCREEGMLGDRCRITIERDND